MRFTFPPTEGITQKLTHKHLGVQERRRTSSPFCLVAADRGPGDPATGPHGSDTMRCAGTRHPPARAHSLEPPFWGCPAPRPQRPAALARAVGELGRRACGTSTARGGGRESWPALPLRVLPCALGLQGFEWPLVASFFLALCLMGGCCWWPTSESNGEGTPTELA